VEKSTVSVPGVASCSCIPPHTLKEQSGRVQDGVQNAQLACEGRSRGIHGVLCTSKKCNGAALDLIPNLIGMSLKTRVQAYTKRRYCKVRRNTQTAKTT
jgi:hypothetical protein